MKITLVYTASVCTIYTECKKAVEYTKLGYSQFNLDPLHLSRDMRYVKRRVKAIGFNLKQNQLDCLAHSVRTNSPVCFELYS